MHAASTFSEERAPRHQGRPRSMNAAASAATWQGSRCTYFCPFESRKEGRNFSLFEIFVSRRTRRTRGTVVRWLRRMSCCRRSRDLRSSVISFSYLVNTPVAEKVSFQERSRFVFMTCTFPGNRSVRGNLCFRCVWCEGREKVIGEHCSNFTVVTTAAWNFCRVRLSVWKTG